MRCEHAGQVLIKPDPYPNWPTLAMCLFLCVFFFFGGRGELAMFNSGYSPCLLSFRWGWVGYTDLYQCVTCSGKSLSHSYSGRWRMGDGEVLYGTTSCSFHLKNLWWNSKILKLSTACWLDMDWSGLSWLLLVLSRHCLLSDFVRLPAGFKGL